eukprot:m.4531 g.4531  ORF g.4531 m.4531 type:complete len:363 (+) comp10919_c0_seq2:346-1434(+)
MTHLTGVEFSDDDFDPPLDWTHKCSKCHKGLRDPFQTACGHRFCSSCLKSVLKNETPRCPIDNEIVRAGEAFPDNSCKLEMLSLSVRCRNKGNGCVWHGPLEHCEAHLKRCLSAKTSYHVQRKEGEESLREMKEQLLEGRPCQLMQPSEISDCQERIRSLEKECQIEFQILQQKYCGLERYVTRSSSRDQDSAISIMPQIDIHLPTFYDGILCWKITEFQRRQSEAQDENHLSICSPPFYTAQSGYKMCARVYLNGNGMEKGSHLSLFFVVMKGEYDALLPWPFQQKVTFTLVNQDHHKRNCTGALLLDPSSASFKRPRSEMNVAAGCPQFVPLEQLSSLGYVKDDTMFIRVEVSTEGLCYP